MLATPRLLLIAIIVALMGGTAFGENAGLEVRVLIGPGLEGTTRAMGRPEKDVAGVFRRAIARDLPGARAVVVPDFTLADIARPPEAGTNRILYVFWTHGDAPESGASLAAADGDHAPTEVIEAMRRAVPAGNVRQDVVLGFCHAGAFDPALFPGDVLGLAPSDGVLGSGDADRFVIFLHHRRARFPSGVSQMYETWAQMLDGESGYGPFWKSVLGANGQRTLTGVRTMGTVSNPVFDSHRELMRQTGYQNFSRCSGLFGVWGH